MNNIDISIENRNGTQIPRRTDSTRSSNKSETLDRDLDFIKETSNLIKNIRLESRYTQIDIASNNKW